MSDKIDTPKIAVTLRTSSVETEAPRLRFLRWKFMTVPSVEQEGPEDDGPGEAERRMP